MAIETSYDNWGGSGDRRDIITSNYPNVVNGNRSSGLTLKNGDKPTIRLSFQRNVYLNEINIFYNKSGLRYIENVRVRVGDQTIVSGHNPPQGTSSMTFSFETILLKKGQQIEVYAENNVTGGGTYNSYIYEIELKLYAPEIKTLILSDGEYKRYEEEKQQEVIYAEDLTKDKVYDASNTYSTRRPSNAFDDDKDTYWMGTWSDNWISVDLLEEKEIIRCGLIQNFASNRGTAKNFSIQYSDDNTTWSTVFEGTLLEIEEIQYFSFHSVGKHRYWRIFIESAYVTGTRIGISEISLFDREDIIIPATPSSWQTVSNTLPTSQQFQEEGMEDLSILDRKVQPVLDSPIQMTSEGLGEGKVFKGKVDLKKYFDLRKLEVK